MSKLYIGEELGFLLGVDMVVEAASEGIRWRWLFYCYGVVLHDADDSLAFGVPGDIDLVKVLSSLMGITALQLLLRSSGVFTGGARSL